VTREKVRIARALGKLPRIDDALRTGVLSYSKVRALCRLATPENEERLVVVALHATAAQLERICRGMRQVRRADEPRREVDQERWVRHRVTQDGMVRVEAQLLPDEAAHVLNAIEAARDPEALRAEVRPTVGDATLTEVMGVAADAPCSVPVTAFSATSAGDAADSSEPTAARSPDVAGGSIVAPAPALSSSGPKVISAAARSPRAVRLGRADALVSIAEAFSASEAFARAPAERQQVMVCVSRDTFDDGFAATFDDGTRVSPATLRRLACDAGLVAVAAGEDGQPLDVGRRRRTIPPSIRRALIRRDGGMCRFPGCDHVAWLEGHHIEHWLHGGPAALSNLILVCSRHHRAVHEDGFTVESASNSVVFRAPDGKLLESSPAPTYAARRHRSSDSWP
jgi:hypothetical protein